MNWFWRILSIFSTPFWIIYIVFAAIGSGCSQLWRKLKGEKS
ncbi:MAG: hypothetical protein WC593_14985 [Methanoregula sp.]